MEFCTNLPLAGVDVRSLVMSRARQEVTVDNDGHLAALGESRYGAAKGARDFLMITVGTGVGGGIFIDGAPYRGSRGLGGELGHTVVELDGPPCPCGGKGHLEAYLGRPGDRRAGSRGRSGVQRPRDPQRRRVAASTASPPRRCCSRRRRGDPVAREILLECGEVLGRALVGFVNIFNPRLVCIGGGIGEAADFMVERASQVMQGEALAGRRDVSVVQAVLGNDAGILGAAAMAFDEHDSREGLSR